MRRFAAPALVGLGAFLILLAILMRFYAYPKLAVAPADQDSTTSLQALDASIFDSTPDVLENITTDLSIKARTVGDVAASEEAGGDTVVWINTQTVTSADGVIRSQGTERTGMNDVTAEAVNCCDSFNETVEGEREPVERTGLVFKFPFGTQKKDYDVWDGTLGEAVKTEFVEETDLQGVTVYKFESDVPQTVVGTREVPGSVLGLDEDSVDADVTYEMHRTTLVEPNTGAIMDEERDTLQTLAVDGQDLLTTTDAKIEYTDEQVDEMVDDYGTLGPILGGLKGLFPLIALGLGAVCVVAGFLLRRRPADVEQG